MQLDVREIVGLRRALARLHRNELALAQVQRRRRRVAAHLDAAAGIDEAHRVGDELLQSRRRRLRIEPAAVRLRCRDRAEIGAQCGIGVTELLEYVAEIQARDEEFRRQRERTVEREARLVQTLAARP